MLSGMARIERGRGQLLNGVAASGLPGGQPIEAAAFWGCLAEGLACIEDGSIDTAATDGESVYWNPAFADSLSEPELIGVWAHEIAHCQLDHMGRRGGRELGLWNVSCDLEINPMLRDHGFTLPKGALFDSRFENMNAEQIYTILEHEKQQQRRPQPQQPQQGQQQPQQGQQQPGQGQGQPQPQQGPQQAPQGQQGQPGQGQPQPGPGQGQQPGQQPQQGQGQPGQPGGPQQGQQGQQGSPGAGQGQQGQPGAGGNPGQGQPGRATDPGRCGGVMDSPKGRKAEIAAQWKAATLQAAAIQAKAEGAGMGEGSTARLVTELRKPKVKWQSVLQDIVTDSCTTADSWASPNKRFIDSGLYLAGQRSDSRARVVIGWDNSGSVNAAAEARFRGEMQKLLDDGLAERFTIVFCDTRVQRVANFEPGQKIDSKAKGGGGTDFRPVFEWLKKNASDAACLIFFTDMDVPSESRFGSNPGIPVIWANWSRPRKAPFGRVIQLDPHN